MEKRIPQLAEMIERARERQAQQKKQAAAKPNPYTNSMMSLLSGKADGIIVKSTESEKRFRICVDDNGNISASEVAE